MRRLSHILAAVLVAAAAGCSGQGSRISLGDIKSKITGPSPKELVVQMFESDDPDVRRSAIEKLSRRDWGRRDPYLKAYSILASDPEATVRCAALRAIGRCGDVKYADNVIPALDDPQPSVRWDAVVALDMLAPPQAVDPLANKARADTSADVRAAAVRALRQYRQRRVLNVLIDCLSDPAFAVRFQAAKSLGELTGRTAGVDPAAWRKIVASRPDPFARPPRLPWWKKGLRFKEPPDSRTGGTDDEEQNSEG